MNETTKNFFQAIEQWHQTTDTTEVFYRLYYDEHGQPVCYSMEHLPGRYLEITAKQFAQSNPHLRVVNGELVQPTRACPPVLQPGDSGQACDPSDVTVVVGSAQPHVKWQLVTQQ